MNVFDSITKFLGITIENHKAEMNRGHRVAQDGGVLSPYELDRMITANAAATGALNVQTVISQSVAYSKNSEENDEAALTAALPRCIRAIQGHLDIAIRNDSTHLGTIRVYNEVLSALRTAEVEGITFS